MNLFDNRTSLKVNIWLRQFRLSHSEIIQLLKEGRSKEIGAEKLRGLQKILPQTEEVTYHSSLNSLLHSIYDIQNSMMIKSQFDTVYFTTSYDFYDIQVDALNGYTGDKEKLASAEKFYLQLLALPQ